MYQFLNLCRYFQYTDYSSDTSDFPFVFWVIFLSVCGVITIAAITWDVMRKKKRAALGLPPRIAPGLPASKVTVGPLSESTLTSLMNTVTAFLVSKKYPVHSQIQHSYSYKKQDDVVTGIILLGLFLPLGIYYLWFRKSLIVIDTSTDGTTFFFSGFNPNVRRAAIDLIESTNRCPATAQAGKESMADDTASTESPDEAVDKKECPYCAETIKAKAVRCRYCGSDLRAAQD